MNTMKGILAALALSVGFAAALRGEVRAKDDTAGTPPGLATGIPWAKDFEEARKESSSRSRPVLVDFYADWCGPCKKLDRETYGDEAVIKLVREHFVPVKVNIDEQKELAQTYEVSSIPTTLILSPGGGELRRIVGFRPPETFIEEIGRAAESSAAFEEIKAAALESPEEAAAQQAYARALVGAGSVEEAGKVLERALERHGDHPGLMLELGDVQRSSGELEAAAKTYRKLLAGEKASDEKRKAHLPLARCYLALRREKESVQVLDSLLAEVQPPPAGGAEDHEGNVERLEAYFLRALSHARLKNAEKAIADLKAARSAAPKTAWGIHAGYIVDLVEPDSE